MRNGVVAEKTRGVGDEQSQEKLMLLLKRQRIIGIYREGFEIFVNRNRVNYSIVSSAAAPK